MARAIWNGVVLAESSRPVLLEGHVYFPPDDVRHQYLARTRAWSVCPWKGLARYYTVRAAGAENKNAAWYYPHPSPLARKIKNHVAFWKGVQVDAGPVPQDRTGAGVARGPGPEPAVGQDPQSDAEAGSGGREDAQAASASPVRGRPTDASARPAALREVRAPAAHALAQDITQPWVRCTALPEEPQARGPAS